MRLREIDFGHVLNSSGARGWFGEGYWFHRVWGAFGLSYRGSTFVAKTTTLEPRRGNMLLDERNRPFDLKPDCIVVKMGKGVVLNSVGLSGPGAVNLMGGWISHRTPSEPYMISFMSVAASPQDRLNEAKAFAAIIRGLVAKHKGILGLQVNFSCPNVGLDLSKYEALSEEMDKTLTLMAPLGIPVLVKVNALFPPNVVREVVDEHPACDGVIVSNTIPWGALPNRIDWKGLFGSETSPLAKYGGGGLSGKPLLPLVAEWIQEARRVGLKKTLVGGGGILSVDDAARILDVGANAIELGSVSILRPWRVRSIIEYVNHRCSPSGE